MATCYIFTQYLQDNGCLFLKINDEDQLEIAPANYSFEDIKNHQKNCKTIIVYPCDKASIFNLDLAWLPERKARLAIPYALEDKLTQSIEDLHFAFDKGRYQNNQYEIAVLEKAPLIHLITVLEQYQINFDTITLDWYALNNQEAIIANQTILVNNASFKGALSFDLTKSFLNIFSNSQIYSFEDSHPFPELNAIPINSHSCTWISQRLAQQTLVNLAQGELQRGNQENQLKKGYQLAGVLAGVLLSIMVFSNAFKLYLVNKETRQIDQQIATIYKKFFPDAKQVVSPKFRITQLLGSSNNAQSNFWNLLNKLSMGIKDTPNTIEQLRFQNKSMIVTIASPDFASLEKLEDNLEKQKLKVTQTQAANRDQQVIATLELM